MALLEVTDLVKNYGSRRHAVAALAGVSVAVDAGRTLAIVGESGSGKSTLGSIVAGLQAPSSGDMVFRGVPLPARARRGELRREIQMVFQSPFQSLNPTMRVETILAEPLRLLARLSPAEASRHVDELLEMVGLPVEVRRRYPKELSGGQQQRVAIARALGPKPDLIVLDEPTSGLDQSVRGLIVALLKDLQRTQGVAYLFITHDIEVARSIAHEVVVMQHGRIVERGDSETVLRSPSEPYTRALLDAVPVMDPHTRRRRAVNSHALTTHPTASAAAPTSTKEI
jgi:peptide/nickel transport system ATP-binding protein